MAVTAPRILKAPIGCRFSGLSHSPGHGAASNGVRTAYGRIRSAASRISSISTRRSPTRSAPPDLAQRAPVDRRQRGCGGGFVQCIGRIDGRVDCACQQRRSDIDVRLIRASAIGPSSWCWATVPTLPTTRPSAVVTGSPVSGSRSPSRPGSASPAGAAAGRGCAPGRRSPGPGSTPFPGARRWPATPPRSGSSGRRCRRPTGAGGWESAGRRRPSCRPAPHPRSTSAAATRPSSARGTSRSMLSSLRRTDTAVGQQCRRARPPGSAACRGLLGDMPGQRTEQRQFGELGGAVGHLDLGPEPHPVEVAQQRSAGAGLGVQIGHFAEFGDDEMVFDVALRRQHQRLGDLAVGQRREELAGQGVQPGQPVGSAHGEHRPVRAIDEDRAPVGGPLFADRVAVVPARCRRRCRWR